MFVVFGCIVRSPWEAEEYLRFARSSQTLWNRKIHYRVLWIPSLSQFNTVYALTSSFLTVHFNIIILSIPRSSMLFVSFLQDSPAKPCVNLCPRNTCHLPSSSHPPSVGQSNTVCSGVVTNREFLARNYWPTRNIWRMVFTVQYLRFLLPWLWGLLKLLQDYSCLYVFKIRLCNWLTLPFSNSWYHQV
jgi:hypothetical protein